MLFYFPIDLLQHISNIHHILYPYTDVLFFHCNTLHRSDKNNSDKRRWTLLCCYNLAKNDPFIEHHHPSYTPIKKLEDNQIRKAGLKFLNPNEAGAFLNRPTAPPQLKRSSGKLFKK